MHARCSYERDTDIITPILHMRKLKLKEVK